MRRAWGSGGCFRVGPRTWRVAIPQGTDAFGVRRKKTWEFTGPDAKARAKAKIREVERRLARGAPLEESRVTVAEYAQDWLSGVRHTVRPSTASFYGSIANEHLVKDEHIGTLPMTRLGPSDIRRLIAIRLDEGYAPRTVRAIIDVLGMMLKQAVGDGLLEHNVAERVAKPKLEQKEPRHFTAEQARRFLGVAQDDPLGNLYAVALNTGLRRGELLSLVWKDVDLRTGTITVRRSKSAAGLRSVPIGAGVAYALAGLSKVPGPIWPVSPSYVTRHFQALCERAGVPVLTFHELRHTAASLMLDSGVDLAVVQSIMGHSRVGMTLHYARAGEALKRDAVERLGRALG